MCGIFGITKTAKFNQSDVSGATLLCHRGPDNEGDWQNEYIKLEHSRLAIIDLDTGTQPITDEQVHAIVFNGEIYNYRELRNNLINRESRFGTVSDTEVIFEAYKELLLHKQRQKLVFRSALWKQST